MAAKHVRSNAFMSQHRQLAAQCLRQAGIAQPQADRIAALLDDAVRHELGGSKVYIPTARVDRATRAARAQALRSQGLSTKDVADRLGLSLPYTYSLLGTELAQR